MGWTHVAATVRVKAWPVPCDGRVDWLSDNTVAYASYVNVY